MLAMLETIGILRIVVIAGLLAAAIFSGTVSYVTLTSYETRSAAAHFRNVAKYANDALATDFAEKKSVVLSMSKNVALWRPNISEWPNVVVPGFYDVSQAQRDSAGFGDVSFLPLVSLDQLSNFETFMFNYFESEPGVTSEAGVSPSGKGVYAYDLSWQTYLDTTGETYTFNSSNRILAPLLQTTFNDYIIDSDLGLNLHSMAVFGITIDAIIECSKRADYSVAVTQCIDLLDMLSLPIDAPKEKVENFFSSFYQPIYLNKNSSHLVGIIGGGFEWIALLSKIFGNHKEGIDIIVRNANTIATFQTQKGAVIFRSYGDLHQTKYDAEELSIMHHAHAHKRMYEPSYTIAIYPTDRFYKQFRSNSPAYASFGCTALLVLLAVTFSMYDYYMRQASAVNEAVLETKRRFVRFISHEIRTPLNAVHLGLEALITEIRAVLTPPQAYENTFLQSLRSWLELSMEMMGNSDSAEEVLNDFLNYDKIEIGTLRMDFSSVPIMDIVQGTVAVFVNPAKLKKINMTLFNEMKEDAQDVRFVVVGDPSRLAQVMRNLISNALKFTPAEGSITIRVERAEEHLSPSPPTFSSSTQHLLHQPRAGSVRISVTDSGAGLSEAQLARICSEGVQFNANELQAGKGSGLGLFITKGIVEQHSGKLTVTSAGIGAGATFVVELPLFRCKYNDADNSASVSILRPSNVPPSTALSRKVVADEVKRILVVDDVLSNRKMLMRILTAKGYVCEQAENGQQAIDVYRTFMESGLGFYAITMDFEMPVMNGPTATKRLREMGCTAPIIAVTGNMLPADVTHFKMQGATEVLGKPLTLVKFQDILNESS